MTNFMTIAKLPRLVLMLAAGAFMLAATEGAVAKNGNNSGNHKEMKSSNSDHKDKDSHKSKDKADHKSKDKDKYKDANKDKNKDKDKVKDANKDKAPVIISGGFVRDKLPNGTVYYRRATQAELEKAAKANGGTTTTTTSNGGGTTPGTGGTSTTGTGGTTTTTGNTPPPAAPAGDTGPVVRDHRPGGNAAYPAPGTIIRDHTNGKDGTPYIVVSAGPTGTVTRKATDADLVKAGLKKPAPPAEVEVPIGMGGGGR